MDKYCIQNSLDLIKNIPCQLIYGNYENVSCPVFSVVIPTYKRGALLIDTLESIINQKNFNLPYEIIIVDNDKDSTVFDDLLRNKNIKYLYYYKNEKNIGGAGNWNRCILLARSNWVIMCHDDDLLNSNCLITMYNILQKHKADKIEIGYIRSNAESFFDNGLTDITSKKRKIFIHKKQTALIKYSKSDVIVSGGATWAGAPTCGTLINKKAFFRVGGYNPALSPCFDCYVPLHMMEKNYGVYETYYQLGKYRWSENDTYRKSTLLGLIKAYNEFLLIVADYSPIVKYFSNENYYDCVKYYCAKGLEANIRITETDINTIRDVSYSKTKLELLYAIRKMHSFYKKVLAK